MGSDFPLVATAASFANFNSRSRMGSDVDDYKTNRSKAQFQFALPCEVKPTAGTSFGAGAGYTFT